MRGLTFRDRFASRRRRESPLSIGRGGLLDHVQAAGLDPDDRLGPAVRPGDPKIGGGETSVPGRAETEGELELALRSVRSGGADGARAGDVPRLETDDGPDRAPVRFAAADEAQAQ